MQRICQSRKLFCPWKRTSNFPFCDCCAVFLNLLCELLLRKTTTLTILSNAYHSPSFLILYVKYLHITLIVYVHILHLSSIYVKFFHLD